MASPGLVAFNAYVDGRGGTARDREELKRRGEELYLAVYRELPSLLGVLGDTDVDERPGDTKLATRQTAFKEWYAKMKAGGEMLHTAVNDRLEGAV